MNSPDTPAEVTQEQCQHVIGERTMAAEHGDCPICLRQRIKGLTAELMIAKHHKALSLLGKSSYQEVVEEKLRVELAETQVAKDAADSRIKELLLQVESLSMVQAAKDAADSRIKELTEENDKFREWLQAREKQVADAAVVITRLSSAKDAADTRNKELEAELAKIHERKFPVQDGPAIPWSVIAPFEKQAQRQHDRQTLERLAQRGGLSVCEVLSILKGNGDYFEYWERSRTYDKAKLPDYIKELQAIVNDATVKAADTRNARLMPLVEKWRASAEASMLESSRIRSVVHEMSDAEMRCITRAELWRKCADELLAALVGGDQP